MMKLSDAIMAELPKLVRNYILNLEGKIYFADKAYNNFRSVLCTPDGYLSVDFSDGDSEELKKGLNFLEKAIE